MPAPVPNELVDRGLLAPDGPSLLGELSVGLGSGGVGGVGGSRDCE